jgi:hypothetical protein
MFRIICITLLEYMVQLGFETLRAAQLIYTKFGEVFDVAFDVTINIIYRRSLIF